MEIRKAVYLISSPSFDQCPAADKPEIAFIGRSNVGKSSLINMITNQEKLAKTSASPGKTQLINHFDILSETKEETGESVYHRWFLVDLPGYGFAKVSQTSRRRWEQMIENYLRKRPNLQMVFVLIDSRLEPQKIDIDFLKKLSLWGVPYTIVFTKTDQESQRIIAKNINAFHQELLKHFQFLPASFSSSATKKSGRNKLLAYLNELLTVCGE